MHLSGLHADIKKIADEFFAPERSIASFLNAFVKGEKILPLTSGSIRGLPRAWRRRSSPPLESRPSFLFLDLPDRSIPDSASRNLAASCILNMVNGNRPVIPVFGVSCNYFFFLFFW